MSPTLPSTLTGSLPGMGGTIMTTVMYIVVLVIVLILGFFMYFMIANNKKFNINVDVYSKRGDEYKLFRDRGAIVNVREVEALKLKKFKKYMPVPEFKFFIQGIKGRSHLNLIQMSTSEFFPAKVNIGVGNPSACLGLTPVERGMYVWADYARELTKKQFDIRTFLEKYGAYMGLAGVALLFIIVVWLSFQNLADLTAQMGSISDKFVGIADKLAPAASEGGAPW